MTSIIQIVRETSHAFADSQLVLPFHECGLDSFDLLEIRVRLESQTKKAIPDAEWFGFKSFADIQHYLDAAAVFGLDHVEAAGIAAQRTIFINMPQMVLGGLSEHWLLKELGDIHWRMTCDALQSESHKLADELGNRLYATFVRVRLESSHNWKKFRENERLDFDGRLFRFGHGMFFSDLTIRSEEKKIQASLMTTFSLRQADNKTLLKGEPLIPTDCKAQVFQSLPAFAEGYRKMRKANAAELVLANERFTVSQDLLFETTYQLNPYQDLNGVNLLYFAAYPTISDYCELEFIRQCRTDLCADRWPAQRATIARDIFYYGNCDLDDRIIFGVNSFSPAPTGEYHIATSLFRESDRQLIANIFTVKERTGEPNV